MSFFKRLSRSRSNSQSYVDSYHSPHDSKTNSQSYDEAQRYAGDKFGQSGQYGSAPVSAGSEPPLDDRADLPSSRQSNQAPQLSDPLAKETSMYPRQSQPTEVHSNDAMYNSPPMSATAPRAAPMSNGYSSAPGGYDSHGSSKQDAPPDLLLQAFNQALRPHQDRVNNLESEVEDLRAYISQLEKERSDVHAWIDTRGLRPGESYSK